MRPVILPILLLAALPVFAAAPLTFEEVDTDGDGLISADEAATIEGLDFDAADADQDGTLSVDEYEIAIGKWAPPDGARPPNLFEEDAPSEAGPAAPETAPAPAKPSTAPETAPAPPAAVPETPSTSTAPETSAASK